MGLRESLSQLASHFEVKEGDAQDVRDYKEAMLEGFDRLGKDVQSLDDLKGDGHDQSDQ
jgi:hypothetical protein